MFTVVEMKERDQWRAFYTPDGKVFLENMNNNETIDLTHRYGNYPLTVNVLDVILQKAQYLYRRGDERSFTEFINR